MLASNKDFYYFKIMLLYKIREIVNLRCGNFYAAEIAREIDYNLDGW